MKATLISIPVLAALGGLAVVLATNPLQAQTRREPARATIARLDLQDWRIAELADTQIAYKAYLKVHPQGWFKPVAEVRTQSGLTLDASQRPYIDLINPTAAQTNAMAEWEEQVWQNARAINTNTAMREYLISLPKGSHSSEAARAYLATLPRLPTGVAPDCTREDQSLQKLVAFDIARAYPARAIDRGLEEEAIGDILVDHTGTPLAWVRPLYTQPTYFAAATERQVLRMVFKPLKAGCMQGGPLTQMQIKFALEGEELPASDRPIRKPIDHALELGEKATLTLPQERALKVSVPHKGQYSVYSVSASAGFLPIISYSRDGMVWRRILNGTHVVANGPQPLFLSISSVPSWLVTAQGRAAAESPVTGPVDITVTRQATRVTAQSSGQPAR